MISVERINRMLKNDDVKRLIENFASLTVLQVAGYIFPLITIPYLARVIGVDKFGQIAFATAVMIYFKTIVDYGFNYTATRDIAKVRENKDKLSEIYSAVMWAKIGLMIIAAVILLILILIVPKLYEMRLLLVLSFCIIPGYIMFPEWLFQGLERMKYITILNVLSKFVFTIAVFVFIKEEKDYVIQPLLLALGFFVAGLISLRIISSKYKIAFLKPSKRDIVNVMSRSTDVFVNQLVPNIYNSFSILLLGFFGGTYFNGIFDAGNRFTNISQQVLNVISRTFFPYLSRNIEKHAVFLRLNIIASGGMVLFLMFFAPYIIDYFFTSEFKDAVLVLRILSISLLFLSLSNIYGTNYMILQGYEKNLRNITIICSVFGFCIAWPLIYYLNFVGAALTISITRGVLGILTTIKALILKKQVV